MSLTRPQKTIIICSTFIAGIGACLLDSFLLTGIIAGLLILFFTYNKTFSVKFSALLLVVLAFSFFYYEFKTPQPDELYKISPARVTLKGSVITEPRPDLENRTKFEFRVRSYKTKSSEYKNINAKTGINIYDNRRKFDNILTGDILELEGYVKPPFEATNPGQFDYKKYLEKKGIFTLTNVRYDAWTIVEHPKTGTGFLIQQLNKIKNKAVDENRKYLKSPKLEVLEGMVFGDYAIPVPKEVKQTFIKSGLLHLLAASGMNVGFIFGFWFFFASKLRIPYKPKMIVGAVLVVFYSLLTGLPPSIMRAAFMTEFLIIGKLFDRKSDTVTLLTVVCTIMLLINPFWLADVSFQLSYLTTFGILLCTQPLLEKTKPVPEFLAGAVIIPLVAQIWASPVQIFHFNNFSTYSVIANILVLPFIGIITFAGFIGNTASFLPLIGSKICFLFDKIAEPFIDIVLFVANYISNLPGALYYFAKPEIPAIIIFYCFVTAVLFGIKKNFSSKKLNITLLILLISLLIFTFKNNFDKKLELVFFDVGQGDAIFIHTPDNKNILVDTGPGGRYTPAKSIIIPYLHGRGINSLDAAVLTHPDFDHIGGITAILKNINVKTVFHNGLNNNSKTCKKIKKYLIQNNIKTAGLIDGQELIFDKDVGIKAVIPPDIDKRTYNENSIILYITYGNFSALLTADCEAEALPEIKKYVKYPVSVLKVGHHGSDNSVNYDFLNYLKPDSAIISVGKRGYGYGHPDKEVLKDLNDFHVKTFRTDKEHAVTIISDGKKYIYKTFANQK